MWRCSQSGCAGLAPDARSAAPGVPTSVRRPLRRGPRRRDVVRRSHSARAARGRRAAERAVGQRREGDAARRLPAPAGRTRARAARRPSARCSAPMIRRSDNAAASQVCNIVGTAGLARLARRVRHAPLPRRRRPWGLSTIDVADQTRFFLRIDRRVPRRHRATRCGCSARSCRPSAGASPACARAAGRSTSRAAGAPAPAGPTTRWRCCAAARRRLSVAILITSSPSHAYGKETLRGVAARLLRGLRPSSRPR